MKILISQLNLKTLDYDYNLNLMRNSLDRSNSDVLTVFPELSLCGSPLYDMSRYGTLSGDCINRAETLCSEKKDFIFGLCVGEDGKKYNSLAFVSSGELKSISTKRNLGMFDDGFDSGRGFEVTEYGDKTLAFGFLEDLEDFVATSKKADVVVCVGSIVFEPERQHRLLLSLLPLVRRLSCPFVFVNRAGAEGRYVFNGGSFVLNSNGNISVQLPFFVQEETFVDTERLGNMQQRAVPRLELLHGAIITGLRDYFWKNGIRKAVVGLSGGIDSALVVALAAEALGRENVIGVLLPSEYSTSHSIEDARNSAEKLGIKYHIMPIKDIFSSTLEVLSPVFDGLAADVAEENLQSRIRGLLLMGIANKIGAAVLNTSNKSEVAVGYGTLYGDTIGGIGAIGDLYKKDVWDLSRWINRNGEIIPENSITKEPSAELRPGQKDTDSLPAYSILDKVLEMYIEGGKTEEEIEKAGFDRDTVRKITRLVKINEWKRRQAAPSLKLSSCTFGIDRLTPIS